MKEINKRFMTIFLRYAIMLLIALPSFWIFYFVFTPLTIYAVYFTLNVFFEVFLTGNVIILGGQIPIEIIPACVAGSAYYLLLILNLSIFKIKLSDRLKMISLSFLAFLIINILRIFIFWYMMSKVIEDGIWF